MAHRNSCGTAANAPSKLVDRSRPRLRRAPIVQTRRAEALPGFRLASPLHEKKETPGESAGCQVCWHSYSLAFSSSSQGPSFSRAPKAGQGLMRANKTATSRTFVAPHAHAQHSGARKS
jgi:hypothetical protein